ncbi:hypothetical protein Tco_1217251 [Tanacetum coccineum]
MGDENLSTIPEKESGEFIKSSVEDLVPIPKESEDTSDNDKECDFPNSVTFFNPLFDSNDDFTSSDDESLPEEDVPEENFKIYSNPQRLALLVTPLSDANEDECFNPGGDIDEIDADVYTDIEASYHDSEGDVISLECLLTNDTLSPEVQMIENKAKTASGTQPADVAVPRKPTWDPHADVAVDPTADVIDG